jgi:hypothetical protein
MPLYIFYPTLKSGLCDTFQSIELSSDERAAERALQVLDEHPSAATVVVYAGHRKILTRARMHPDLAAILGPRAIPRHEPAAWAAAVVA